MAIAEETGKASGRARQAERVAKLCSFGERRAGTDAERRAAAWLAGEGAEAVGGGARAASEPTYVHPQWPAVGFFHCLLAIAGSLLAGVSPIAAFALVFVTAVSFYLDLAGRWYLLRSLLFFRRASQNVVVPPIPEDADRPRVIVCAHYDAPRTGAAYNSWAVRSFARFTALWPARTSPQAVAFWAIALLLPPLGLRLAGIDADWVSAAQLPQTFVLLLGAFMYGEIALSPPSPGANDNATGVAAALAVAERLREDPPESLEVSLLFAGAGETTREGARSFIRAHRKELPRDSTWFVDIDSAGRGTVRWVELEVPVIAQPPARPLAEMAAALTEGDPYRRSLPIAPASAASLAGAYGYPSIALTARQGDGFVPVGHHTPADTPESIDPEAIESVAGLAVDLIRLLDRDVGRRAAA
jgi:hypothetical protein